MQDRNLRRAEFEECTCVAVITSDPEDMSPALYLTILFLGVALAAPIFDSSFDAQWYKWKMRHGRTYNPNTEELNILDNGFQNQKHGNGVLQEPQQKEIPQTCGLDQQRTRLQVQEVIKPGSQHRTHLLCANGNGLPQIVSWGLRNS
ncbi:hypothetical protein LEMLEM_LOCUS8591 [Lemmus lemmus]